MLQWAENIEAPPSPQQLPVGISQQEATTAEEEQQTEDKQHPPVPEDSDIFIFVSDEKTVLYRHVARIISTNDIHETR